MTFETHAADELVRESHELARIWAKCVARHWTPAQRQALTFHLAGHMPAILRRVAEFVRDDTTYSIADDAMVVTALGTIARLRRSDGSSPADLMREFDLLAQVLDGACLDWLRSYPEEPEVEAVVRVTGRLNRAPILMGQISMEAFWAEEPESRRELTRGMQEFADMVAHELNTPLNAASMTAQLLEYADNGSPEARRLALLIRRQLERASAVMRDVRAATTAGPGQAPHMMPFGQVLGEVLADVRDEVRADGVRLEIDEPIPGISVDAPRVKIVLVNLIRNAIKYSNPSRAVRWIRVRFSRQSTDGVWWVEVSDNGLGIPEEHHDRIFRESFRAHPDRADGTGLGLLIVRQEVELLGGHLEFSSEPEIGTTFRFTLRETAEA